MSPVSGTKWDAMPAIAKATEPTRLSAATHHSACRRGRQNTPPHISPQASPLAIRKQAQPNTSGAQISRFSCAVERPSCSASNVLTLKNSVPANWTTAAHQSIRPGSRPNTRSRCRSPTRSGLRSALTVSRYCSAAAAVKNSEPAKNTAASVAAPTSCTNPGNGPKAKHAEPMMNSTAIHQDRRRGAHHPEPPGSDPPLRWARDRHSVVPPSSRRNVTCVVNGPNRRDPTAVHPGGVSGYAIRRI